MKNLENIPKKDIFSVPEGYFDGLPGRIQARITPLPLPSRYTPTQFALRFALPVVVLLAVTIFVFRNPATSETPEGILASVSTQEIIAYLEESDVTTDELLDQFDYSPGDVQAIEQEVFTLPDDELVDALEDFELNDNF